MENNKFSIITTCFNDSKNAASYLDNIARQTLLPYELIIVDGGSKDNTCKVIQDYSVKCPFEIKIITDGRLNIAEAFNIGIKNAVTDYVLITCMGNYFSENMCELLFNNITSESTDASYGLLMGVDTGKFSTLYNKAFIRTKGNDIMSNRCVLYKKSIFDKIGYFIENFKYAGEDAEFLLRFDRSGLKRSLVPHVTVFWETPNSWSAYAKQRENYAIAELQYGGIIRNLFNGRMVLVYGFFILILVGLFFKKLLVLLILLSIIRFVMSKSHKSLNVFLLQKSAVFLKLYYSVKNIRYGFPSNRVSINNS